MATEAARKALKPLKNDKMRQARGAKRPRPSSRPGGVCLTIAMIRER